MLIHNFLENSADKYPDKPAVWYRSEWKSYVQINCLANQVSNFLVDKGIQRGDRVALLFENSFEYIISYYAILKAGGVAVALNTDQVPNDLLYLLNHSGARALIIQNKFIPILKKLSNQTATLETILTDRVNEDDDRDERVSFYEFEKVYSTYSETKPSIRLINIDLAAIIYTSGSTGRPKGVTLTHLNIVTNTNSIIEYLDLSETDRIMVILPFPYVYGKSLLNTHFAAGGSVVIDNRFVFPNAILETMLTTDCTGFAGVPSTFSILLNKSSVKKYKFPRLRYLTQAGGPMAPAVQKEVASTLSPAKLFIMYGATEASARLSYLDPLVLSRKWGSIGKPIPNVDLYVADEKGNPVTPGETGEIVARGANIMVGYWNDQEETERVLRYGLYFTGDLGVMDDEGYIYVVGRLRNMIKAGANRVSAKEIEEKILEHHEVHEIAVIGVEDEILGEAIKAFVVPKTNADDLSRQLLNFCKETLPPYKVPKYIEIVETLPKNASGKILKTKLKNFIA